MKTIGLIGGMSWESSIEYYRIINEEVRARLGGLHAAKSLMYSVDFAAIEQLQHSGDWDTLTDEMVAAAKRLERGGADFVLLCTNTMHKTAVAIEQNSNIPLLHIADATAERIKASGIQKIGLLGTKFTMEQAFYKGRLSRQHGLNVIVPNDADRQIVHDVIYNELCLGSIQDSSRHEYRRIMARLIEQGAEGIILGCTEITLLVNQADCSVPQFDTTQIHAKTAVAWALQG